MPKVQATTHKKVNPYPWYQKKLGPETNEETWFKTYMLMDD